MRNCMHRPRTTTTLARFAFGAFSGNPFLCFVLLFAMQIHAAISDTIPLWLDTIPPVVKIHPQSPWQSTVFHITLSANERANLFLKVAPAKQFSSYRQPFTLTKEGSYVAYFYGEDDFGNKSAVDSMKYKLDSRAPHLVFSPLPGHFRTPVVVRVSADEPCVFYRLKSPLDTAGTLCADSIVVNTRFEGWIAATDRAGNRTVSEKLAYIVDTAGFKIIVDPPEGVFNHSQSLRFKSPRHITVYHTFDPLAPPKWFKKYTDSVPIPYGLGILRYYGVDTNGIESEIVKVKYVVDTIAPRLHVSVVKGARFDTLFLTTRERATIRYTLNGNLPTPESETYDQRLIIPRQGKCLLKAKAWDEAGNASETLEWEYKYDKVAPIIKLSNPGGAFTKPQVIYLTANEPAKIFYTLDLSEPGPRSKLYTDEGILISRDDTTTLRYCAVDEAENWSEQKAARYFLDTRPPVVRVRVDGKLQEGNFRVNLSANEPATIHYEIGGANPGRSSPVYAGPIALANGQTLSYIAFDRAGNASRIGVMDELRKPMVSAMPEPGVYNRRLRVSFAVNAAGLVYWRLLPDTTFRTMKDSLIIDQEGSHSLEYFFETNEGLRSATRRNEYFIDWTPPRVDIAIKKGMNDSVSIFFECSENATIYYTTNGTSPLYGSNAKIAGNKFLQSRDRISILRSENAKLAFYAEDIAGNQSALQVLDVFKPRSIPNVPSGRERVYDRILSVSLNAFEGSTVYYSRHGRMPTTDSSIFRTPLTLMKSDTIIAFVIDASGFRGDPDTFIYLIDLPPSPQFIVSGDSLAGSPLLFDASGTIDQETPSDQLLYRWDFDGDGVYDTKATHDQRVSYTFKRSGFFTTHLEVSDPLDRHAVYKNEILVLERCPDEMVSFVDRQSHSFCIDRYEWPNIIGKEPRTAVSWVEAKMACIDAGKRLCTAQEWQAACAGNAEAFYPYGNFYEEERCPSHGKTLWKSGQFRGCGRSASFDMLGNAWEWIEDKDGDYPLLIGGSYKHGKDAHCKQLSTGTVASRSNDVGFRCCK